MTFPSGAVKLAMANVTETYPFNVILIATDNLNFYHNHIKLIL